MTTKKKVCFLGDAGVGKTSIVNSYTYNEFHQQYKPTVGIDFISKPQNFGSFVVKAQIWDAAGQQRFRSLLPSYIKSSDICLLIYDVTNRQSFNYLHKIILPLLNENYPEIETYLIANKIDLQTDRCICQEEGMEFCEKYKMKRYFQISAKDYPAICNMFRAIFSSFVPDQEVKQEQDTPQQGEILVQQIKPEEKKEEPKAEQQQKQQKKQQIEVEVEVEVGEFDELDLSENTLEYLQEQRINKQILIFMTQQDIRSLPICVGDQFRIIMKMDKK